jgi:hypothetical protein
MRAAIATVDRSFGLCVLTALLFRIGFVVRRSIEERQQHGVRGQVVQVTESGRDLFGREAIHQLVELLLPGV